MTARQRKLRMEQMEAREMMAGDVNAYVQNGNLFLNEAAGNVGRDQAVVISQLSNGKIRVEGGLAPDGKMSDINKGAYRDFDVPGSLFVNFGGGRDRVDFSPIGNVANFQDVYINVGIASATGDADKDQVSLAKLNVRGSLTILSGASDDAIYVNGGSFGDGAGIDRFVIKSGAGADNVHVKMNAHILGDADIQTYDSLTENHPDTLYMDHSIYVSKSLSARLGGGDDSLFVSTPSAFSVLALQVDGSMLVEMGTGNDQVYMAGAEIGYPTQGKLTLLTGAGEDNVTIDNRGYALYRAEIKTYDSLAENDADRVQIQNAMIIQDLVVEMGGGNDQFSITDPADTTLRYGIRINGGMRLDMGSGHDIVHIEGSNVGDHVGQDDLVINSGAGQDSILLDFRPLVGNYVGIVTGSIHIQTYESITEPDADQVRVYNGIMDNLFAKLGAGDDIFELNDVEGIHGDLRMEAGAGNDTAFISGFVMQYLMALMGEGDDSLTFGLSWAYRVIADGGFGTDRLATTGGVYANYFDKYGWEYINGKRLSLWGIIGDPIATGGMA